MPIIFIFNACAVCSAQCLLGNSDSFKVSLNPPYAKGKEIFQTIDISATSTFIVSFRISCYQLMSSDSIHIYDLVFPDITVVQGVKLYRLDLDDYEHKILLDQSFFEAIRRSETLLPGSFVTFLTIKSNAGNLTKSFAWDIDSNLSYGTNFRKKVNDVFSENRLRIQSKLSKKRTSSKNEQGLQKSDIDRTAKKLNKKLRKIKGVKAIPETQGDKTYNRFYYEKWFLGRYEIVAGKSMKERIAEENSVLKTNPSSLVNNDLEGFTSLRHQFKRLNKNRAEDKETTGAIDFSSSYSSGQEPGSEQKNNFHELQMQANTYLLKVPVSIEGYLTTQDAGRAAKAGYLRLSYDIETAKKDLAGKISSYKSKMLETKNKRNNLDVVYGQIIEKLKSEHTRLKKEIEDNGNINAAGNINSLELSDSIFNPDSAFAEDIPVKAGGKADSNINAKKTEIENSRRKVEENQKKIKENQKKIERYETLIKQYKNQSYFDSVTTFKKLDDLASGDVSYKQMLKASKEILPEEKTTGFFSGLTKMEAGILNVNESEYTMAGQTMKGGAIGYDLGFVQTTVSAGITEYVSRDGNVDQYNCGMVRLDFKPLKKQKFGLIYYMYAPTKSVFSDSGFASDVKIPALSDPINVMAIAYEGYLNKDVFMQMESAFSYRKSDRTTAINSDKNATKISLTYDVPFLPASINGEWEYMGRDFENKSIPYIKTATERYTLATKFDVFQSYVTVGVQYNFLKQTNFAVRGYNIKWGVDVKTNFKRYPNLLLSYKPFSTFRKHNDTFFVPQRPMFGEVWTAKATYQMRREGISHRFLVTYNLNSSSLDSVSYKNMMLQAGYIYLSELNISSMNIGCMKTPLSDSSSLSTKTDYFINTAFGRKVGKNVTISIGQDMGFFTGGVQRVATTFGTEYSFESISLSLRANVRYAYVNDQSSMGSHLFGGQIGANWQFRIKPGSSSN